MTQNREPVGYLGVMRVRMVGPVREKMKWSQKGAILVCGKSGLGVDLVWGGMSGRRWKVIGLKADNFYNQKRS